ncbi:MAG: tetratricopeptide repeat protein [Alphaproteobacteria bacterium]|nr:tetratricopeptide repeat protein [Alphaproteobacteria bacterium]
MSDDSEALIREIEEEVRREKLAKLWNQYGIWVFAGLAAIVVMVGGWQWYSAYQTDQAQKAGGQFQEAMSLLEGDKKSDGLKILEQIAAEGTPGYAALAQLRLGAAAREAGETEKALRHYQAVADNASADRLLRSFASLQIASLKVDSGSWTEVQNRLNDLADETSPWRHSARELLGLAAYKHGKWAEAKEAYTSLMSDQDVPPDIRQRAQVAMALITRDEAKATSEKPAQPTGTAPDLKKDKTTANGGNATAGAGEKKPVPAPSDGVGAKDDAGEKK